jgi:pimeloyl-ACP methyl ester carboxylesterase
MHPRVPSTVLAVLALLATCAIAVALWHLHATTRGLRVESLRVDGIPVTVFRPDHGPAGPVVLIAHGFAGSQQLMQPLATELAHNGYSAVTFDFPGHGRNAEPLSGDITRVDGATRSLVATMVRVAAYARTLSPGPIAVLGHSMATDVVVRFAEETPDVVATIAVSMFSPAVTAESPRNLLVIVGAWESRLKAEALRAVGLATAPTLPQAGVTYGDLTRGTGRRVAFSPGVEHIGVLYSPATMREALAWADAAFHVSRTEPPYIDARGGWIVLLFAGIVLLARPLAQWLPVVAREPRGAGRRWRPLWIPIVVPAVLTPLVLRVLPTHVLPVLVADYLALHFAAYGLITMACLRWTGPRAPIAMPVSRARLAVAAAAVTLYAIGAVGGAMNAYVTSFVLGFARVPLAALLLAGTLSFFLTDEWLTRGVGAGRGAYPVTKVAFLFSLGLAVALDFQRLFFLVIIVPVMVVFFVVYGLFSRWAYRRTGHPLVAGIANAAAFAWAISVTFPMLAG